MGLLDRARRVLGSRPASGPVRAQVYRVACPEGHVLHGHRTEGYQALRCPECDQGIFVLPRSPLPEPAPPRAGARTARPARRPSEPDDLVLDNPPSPAEVAWARAEHAATRPRHGPVATPAPSNAEPEAEIEWVDEIEEPGAPPREDDASAEPAKTDRQEEKLDTGLALPAEARRRPAQEEAPTEPEPVPPGMIAIEERPGSPSGRGGTRTR